MLRVIRWVFEIETDWISCISTKRSGSSCSKLTLESTKRQGTQSKSSWDDSRSWACKGLPNKAITQKKIKNTRTVNLDPIESNLPELNKDKNQTNDEIRENSELKLWNWGKKKPLVLLTRSSTKSMILLVFLIYNPLIF